jgi:hypothetical protein
MLEGIDAPVVDVTVPGEVGVVEIGSAIEVDTATAMQAALALLKRTLIEDFIVNPLKERFLSWRPHGNEAAYRDFRHDISSKGDAKGEKNHNFSHLRGFENR